MFKIKKYDVICDLYFYLKKNIDLNDFDCLFEIAYSLKEKKYNDESEFIYNIVVDNDPNNGSALNNLAIILEEKGKLNKAIELIKKAKGMAENDDYIIDNNFKRLTSHSKSKKESKKRVKHEKEKVSKLVFNPEKSVIFYGNKSCEIPINTYEYYLCKAVFENPLGTKIPEENIYDLLDSVKLEERKRTIYDTCLRINKKAEIKLGIKKILINRASMLWVRDELIE